MIRDNAAVLEKALSAAFAAPSTPVAARHAFTVLDSCKAMLTRRLSLDRRAGALGFPKADITLGLTTNHDLIENYLKGHPSLTVLSLYLAHDMQVWCASAKYEEAQQSVQYNVFNIINESTVQRFGNSLRKYALSLSAGAPDFGLQEEVVQILGAGLLPTVSQLDTHEDLVLIPHRALHLLPLHAMSIRQKAQVVHLDDLVKSITYSSSLFEMHSPRVVAGPDGFGGKQARMLAVIDTSSHDLEWLEAERLYFEGLARLGLRVDVVTREDELPSDLSGYIWISWGGHARSDPTSWGGSFLTLGNRMHSARSIACEWTCSRRPWVLLSACASAIDTAEISSIDEYCGLDLAFYIAGAWGTFATMWPVRDELAAVVDVLLTHMTLFGRSEPPRSLAIVQRALRRGHWKRLLQGGDRLPAEIRRSFGMIERLTDRAFETVMDWSAFRSYGVSSDG